MSPDRLTPHQKGVLAHYTARRHLVDKCGIRADYCAGAVAHLVDKGYLTVENRPGPRGGERLYVVGIAGEEGVLVSLKSELASKVPCPYCSDTDKELDTDRETRPMVVCSGCGLTVQEAVGMVTQ